MSDEPGGKFRIGIGVDKGMVFLPLTGQVDGKGLEQLLQTIGKVRRQINPKLKIEGILLTMTDSRTTYGKQIDNLIRQGYGRKINVFEQTIPRSVRAAEISAAGKSIFAYLFNHRTNVNVNNRIVCYDIKELGKQMKKLGIPSSMTRGSSLPF